MDTPEGEYLTKITNSWASLFIMSNYRVREPLTKSISLTARRSLIYLMCLMLKIKRSKTLPLSKLALKFQYMRKFEIKINCTK